ncbi:hypothetical protein F5X96DRAFT_674312 [Biscogniauxia mediterranea]|nr:hypothetical protein F5X96DRAFT_674312 [Biscogniauxia mediterranea]
MAAPAVPNFRIGMKKLFLPDHMITFLRPPANQPAQFATFKVPLRFNKLDLRDYLFHAYNVSVLGVRSHLKQQRVRRSKFHHRIYRPPPIKTMTVELTSPFVWPKQPADKSPWNSAHAERSDKLDKKSRALARKMERLGRRPLYAELPPEKGTIRLRQEAKRLLREGGWKNDRTLDPRFEERK